MLSRDSKIVLRAAKHAKGQQVSYTDMKKTMGWEYDKARSVAQQLIDEGYALEKKHSPMPGSSIPWGIILSEKGRNNVKYFFATIGDFLLKSIATPILVAFLTTLVTLWIKGIFGF